jgi:monoterpene epsilon-lactone hydrolase
MTRELERIRAALKQRLPMDAPLDLRRVAFEQLGAGFPAVNGIRVTHARFKVPGLWFEPESAPEHEAIMLIHGGAFNLGSSAAYTGYASRVALAAGRRLFCPDYRLAPEHPFPAGLDDVHQACAAIRASGVEQLALVGDSAGANLAVAVSQRQRRSGGRTADAVVGVSGYYDLTNSAPSIASRASRDPFLDASMLHLIRETYLAGHTAAHPEVSPLFGDWEGLPPLLLMVGSEEILHDDTLRAADKARAAGVEVVQETWPDMIHIWPYFAQILPQGQHAINRIGSFVRQHLTSHG